MTTTHTDTVVTSNSSLRVEMEEKVLGIPETAQCLPPFEAHCFWCGCGMVSIESESILIEKPPGYDGVGEVIFLCLRCAHPGNDPTIEALWIKWARENGEPLLREMRKVLK